MMKTNKSTVRLSDTAKKFTALFLAITLMLPAVVFAYYPDDDNADSGAQYQTTYIPYNSGDGGYGSNYVSDNDDDSGTGNDDDNESKDYDYEADDKETNGEPDDCEDCEKEEPEYDEDDLPDYYIDYDLPDFGADYGFDDDFSWIKFHFDGDLFITPEEYTDDEEKRNALFLAGVTAKDLYGQVINDVWIVDFGGFDINAEWPYNQFTVTYAARHPELLVVVTAERYAFAINVGVVATTGSFATAGTEARLREIIGDPITYPNPVTITITDNFYMNNTIHVHSSRHVILFSDLHTELRMDSINRHFVITTRGILSIAGRVRLTRSSIHVILNHYGGGIEVSYGTLNMQGVSSIYNNRNLFGGGILTSHPFSVVNIQSGGISRNSANSLGGGIYNRYGIVNLYDGGLFENSINGVWARGGGIYNHYGTVNINGGSVTRNNSFWLGGGIYNHDGKINIYSGIIDNNTAEVGGGIFVRNGKINFPNELNPNALVISNNKALSRGGGIFLNAPEPVNIQSTRFNTNIAGYGINGTGIGGAVYTNNIGLLSIHNNVRFEFNRAHYDGNIHNAWSCQENCVNTKRTKKKHL